MKSRLSLALGLLLLAGLGCDRKPKPAPPAEAPKAPLAPWNWRIIGGLLVVEGEVDEPTDLILKGQTLNERRHVEFGPVRWELYRPPKGEVAELRTGTGRLLIRMDFDAPKPPPPPKPAPLSKPAPVKPSAPVSKAPIQPKPAPPAKPAPKKTVPPAKPAKPEPKPPAPSKIVIPAPKPPPAHAPIQPKPAPSPAPKPAPTPRPEPKIPAPSPAPKEKTAIPKAPRTDGCNLLRGPRGGKQVCLTFDGGSSAEVAEDVLEILQTRHIRTTFFLTGAFIHRFPDLVRRIHAAGHEIGNHTQNHPHMAPGGRRAAAWTRERVQAELRDADLAFQKLLGRPMDPLWRAPYGEHSLEIRQWAEELGYRHVGWSEGADTLDWATRKERSLYRTGHAILDRLKARMERQDGDGLIVLMHLGSARPVEDRPAKVLGPFIDRALAEGWRFVSIGDYLKTLDSAKGKAETRKS
ncbi:MAG: polysaccharide deacetylase family protein [Firmicutes bacterium]|nr:polysaccharide deacetylase family protein [Bacillota bacterium]